MPSQMKWAIALLLGFVLIVVGWRWAPSVLYAFFIVNCFVLIIVVLLQSGKAADLAGAFGGAGSQTAFGPRGAANVLSRTTTWCAIMFMACALALVLRQERLGATGSSVLERTAKPAPAAPAQSPSQQPPANQPVPAGQPQPSPEAPKKP
jgi:preprotein translocase subunit SecG